MTTKIDPIFLIKQKDTNLFLYSFLDENTDEEVGEFRELCLLYTSPSPRDRG